ncbi:MAG: ATP-binding cassette domain-containing protein [Planctomycetota bacterium]|nr:MAG: ATP-binding cassette domain-containing protein [Planctomycetota bacterium]
MDLPTVPQGAPGGVEPGAGQDRLGGGFAESGTVRAPLGAAEAAQVPGVGIAPDPGQRLLVRRPGRPAVGRVEAPGRQPSAAVLGFAQEHRALVELEVQPAAGSVRRGRTAQAEAAGGNRAAPFLDAAVGVEPPGPDPAVLLFPQDQEEGADRPAVAQPSAEAAQPGAAGDGLEAQPTPDRPEVGLDRAEQIPAQAAGEDPGAVGSGLLGRENPAQADREQEQDRSRHGGADSILGPVPHRMSSSPALLASGLALRLGRTPILHGVDLEVRRGDLYGLLGRNGAGKTTTLRALLGFLPSFRGVCEVFGRPSRALHRVQEPIGVALDPPGLDETLTVRQNLELARIRGGIRSGRGVDEVLDLVGLRHRQHHRGGRLSHGQGRRAAVARALLGSPRLLVLDEPLSGLDPEGVEQMLDLFRRLAREEGVTVVLSSHHLREVQEVCTRIGVIEAGRTVLEGETAALLAEAGEALELVCAEVETALRILVADAGVRDATPLGDGRIRARVEAGFDPAPLLAGLVRAGAGVREFRPLRASLVDLFQQAVRDAGKRREGRQ